MHIHDKCCGKQFIQIQDEGSNCVKIRIYKYLNLPNSFSLILCVLQFLAHILLNINNKTIDNDIYITLLLYISPYPLEQVTYGLVTLRSQLSEYRPTHEAYCIT